MKRNAKFHDEGSLDCNRDPKISNSKIFHKKQSQMVLCHGPRPLIAPLMDEGLFDIGSGIKIVVAYNGEVEAVVLSSCVEKKYEDNVSLPEELPGMYDCKNCMIYGVCFPKDFDYGPFAKTPKISTSAQEETVRAVREFWKNQEKGGFKILKRSHIYKKPSILGCCTDITQECHAILSFLC